MLRLFVSLTLLAFSTTLAFYPPSANLTSKVPVCEDTRCVLELTKNQQRNCTLNESFSKKVIRLHASKQISSSFIQAYFTRKAMHFCPGMCTVENFFRHFWLNFQVQLEYAIVWGNDTMRASMCAFPLDYCRWWSRNIGFIAKFTVFALPSTVILNWVNLSTLTKLMETHKTPAAALYLHRFEIFSDVLLCFSLYFYEFRLYYALKTFTTVVCFPSLFVDLYEFFLSFIALLTMINQCAILNLLSDRRNMVRDPLGYKADAGKSIAREVTLRAILTSALVYSPLLLIRTFSPLLAYWLGAERYGYLYTVSGVIYALPPIFCVALQIYRGRQYELAYRAFQKRRAIRLKISEAALKVFKNNERDKRALLGGTLGLNLVTTGVNWLISAVVTPAYYTKNLYWWLPILHTVQPVGNFFNGSVSFIIHIILVKQYRVAFFKTAVGRVFYRAVLTITGLYSN